MNELQRKLARRRQLNGELESSAPSSASNDNADDGRIVQVEDIDHAEDVKKDIEPYSGSSDNECDDLSKEPTQSGFVDGAVLDGNVTFKTAVETTEEAERRCVDESYDRADESVKNIKNDTKNDNKVQLDDDAPRVASIEEDMTIVSKLMSDIDRERGVILEQVQDPEEQHESLPSIEECTVADNNTSIDDAAEDFHDIESVTGQSPATTGKHLSESPRNDDDVNETNIVSDEVIDSTEIISESPNKGEGQEQYDPMAALSAYTDSIEGKVSYENVAKSVVIPPAQLTRTNTYPASSIIDPMFTRTNTSTSALSTSPQSPQPRKTVGGKSDKTSNSSVATSPWFPGKYLGLEKPLLQSASTGLLTMNKECAQSHYSDFMASHMAPTHRNEGFKDTTSFCHDEFNQLHHLLPPDIQHESTTIIPASPVDIVSPSAQSVGVTENSIKKPAPPASLDTPDLLTAIELRDALIGQLTDDNQRLQEQLIALITVLDNKQEIVDWFVELCPIEAEVVKQWQSNGSSSSGSGGNSTGNDASNGSSSSSSSSNSHSRGVDRSNSGQFAASKARNKRNMKQAVRGLYGSSAFGDGAEEEEDDGYGGYDEEQEELSRGYQHGGDSEDPSDITTDRDRDRDRDRDMDSKIRDIDMDRDMDGDMDEGEGSSQGLGSDGNRNAALDLLWASDNENNRNSSNNRTRTKTSSTEKCLVQSHVIGRNGHQYRTVVKGAALANTSEGSLRGKLDTLGLVAYQDNSNMQSPRSSMALTGVEIGGGGDGEEPTVTGITSAGSLEDLCGGPQSPGKVEDGAKVTLFADDVEVDEGVASQEEAISYGEFIARFTKTSDLVEIARKFLFSVLGPMGDCTPPVDKSKVNYVYYGPVKLQERCLQFFDDMQDQFERHPQWKDESESRQLSIRDCLEQYMMSRLAAVAVTTVENTQEDERLARRMKLLSFLTPAHLDIKEDSFDETLLAVAGEELKQISSYKTPGEKVACVVKSAGVVFRSLSLSRAKRDLAMGSEGQETNCAPAGADDFLPLFIWVVLRTRIPSLFTNCEYMQAFLSPTRLMGKSGYCLINLKSALEFCSYIDADTLTGITTEDFDKRMKEGEMALSKGRK